MAVRNPSTTAANAVAATVPVAGGVAGETIKGAAGVTRTVLFAWTAKHEAKAKIKLKHELGTAYVEVSAVWKATSKVATEQIPIEKVVELVKYVSANEVEITLKEEITELQELFIVVQG